MASSEEDAQHKDRTLPATTAQPQRGPGLCPMLLSARNSLLRIGDCAKHLQRFRFSCQPVTHRAADLGALLSNNPRFPSNVTESVRPTLQAD